MHLFGLTVLATIYFFAQTGAQIPYPCAYNYTMGSKYCCPVPDLNASSIGACGIELGRGQCVPVSQMCNTDYNDSNLSLNEECMIDSGDERLNWPQKVFTHTCRCNGNYGDYDCGKCQYGYTEESGCTERVTVPRRSITSFSGEEWEVYLELLNKSKHENSRCVVLGANQQVSNITTYNLFVWLHHYAAKDHLFNYDIPDSGKNDVP